MNHWPMVISTFKMQHQHLWTQPCPVCWQEYPLSKVFASHCAPCHCGPRSDSCQPRNQSTDWKTLQDIEAGWSHIHNQLPFGFWPKQQKIPLISWVDKSISQRMNQYVFVSNIFELHDSGTMSFFYDISFTNYTRSRYNVMGEVLDHLLNPSHTP